MAPPSLVILSEEQLRHLAKLIYRQEVEVIHNIKFNSEPELAKYLRECKSGYQNVLGILDAGRDVTSEFQKDITKASIAHDITSYAVKAVNLALQSVRSFTMRMNYLSKIREHSASIIEALKTLDATNVINVAYLAKDAANYNKAILHYTKQYQSLPSKAFSWFTDHGYKFQDLVQRYQNVLGFGGKFKNLEDVKKIQVYDKIIEASGLGKTSATVFETVSGAIGLAVIIFTAGLMVWDIYSSDHKIKTVAEGAVMILAPIAGAMIGSAVGTALEAGLVGLVNVASVVVSVVGFVAGAIAGFILAGIGNFFIDLIFGSGGTTLSTDGHRCYIAEVPNGEVLARQISHQSSGSSNFGGLFKDLEDAKKLQVYNEIIEASGLGKSSMTKFEVASGAIGMAVLLFTAGMMVWDIYSSDHKIKTAAQDAVMILAAIGGAMIGSAIGTALRNGLVGAVNVSSTTVSVIGFVAAGWLYSRYYPCRNR